MRPSPLPTLALAALLAALPGVLHGQTADKMSKPAPSTMAGMKDTSGMAKQGAMTKDGMSKDGMSKDGMSKDGMSKDAMAKSKSKSKGTMTDHGSMADPEKKTHP